MSGTYDGGDPLSADDWEAAQYLNDPEHRELMEAFLAIESEELQELVLEIISDMGQACAKAPEPAAPRR